MTKLVLCLFLVQFLGVNAQVQGSLRLVGSLPSEGRLEVYINGHWGTVCGDYWSYNNTRVACRQLGYTGVKTSFTPGPFSPSGLNSQRIWLNNVRCTGNESQLIYCSHNGYGIEDCSHSQDVGIHCMAHNGNIYLLGRTSSRGSVHVYYSGEWHIVCYNRGWRSIESTAACKQLGYARALITTYVGRSVYDQSYMVSVRCSSGASSLYNCSISKCSSSFQLFVECTNSTVGMPNQHSDGDVRFAGGSLQHGGHVEVYYSGIWRTTCYDLGWNNKASLVVCKQFGYALVDKVTSTSTNTESGPLPVSVYCNGYENSLAECEIGPHTSLCFSKAVVVCTNTNTPLVWTILIPLVCGLIVLCVLCVPCVVACCLYHKKKPRASTAPGSTAEGTVRYTTSDEQPRVGYPTLPSTDREGEVQINYHSGDSGQIRVDTTVGPGLVVMDQPPEDVESPPPFTQQDQPLDSLQKQ